MSQRTHSFVLCKHETQNWLLLHFTNAWPRPQGHPVSPAELLDVLSPRGLNIRRMGSIWKSFRKKLASWHGNSHKTIIRQWKMWGNSHKTIIRQFHKTIRFPWFYVYFGDLCSINLKRTNDLNNSFLIIQTEMTFSIQNPKEIELSYGIVL